MASRKRRPAAEDPVIARLEDGYYDRLLAEFETRIEEATATLRRAYDAMKAENTLRS